MPVPFKPNYKQQRADRNRMQEARKQEKLEKQREIVVRRKAAREAIAAGEEPDTK